MTDHVMNAMKLMSPAVAVSRDIALAIDLHYMSMRYRTGPLPNIAMGKEQTFYSPYGSMRLRMRPGLPPGTMVDEAADPRYWMYRVRP